MKCEECGSELERCPGALSSNFTCRNPECPMYHVLIRPSAPERTSNQKGDKQ